MCRAQSEGGRRCPSCTNPEAVKAYNTIRRARYAASRDNNNTVTAIYTKIPKADEIITEIGETISVRENLYKTTDKEAILSVSPNDSELANLNYESRNIITGTPELLSNDNYGDNPYGFIGAKIYGTFNSYKLLKNMSKISEEELMEATAEERLAGQEYSTSFYRKVNSVLFGRTKYEDLSPSEQERFDNLVPNLDSLIGRGPGTQKKLYRGVKPDSNFFNFEPVDEWVMNNLEVGGEISFSGYTSTTTLPEQATEFAYGETGLIYEIFTPQGINITSISDYGDNESEILLPRNTRYKIVGIQYNDWGGAVVQLVAVDDNGQILN